MEKYVRSKGKYPKKMYFFYTTCPKCAEYYGANLNVIKVITVKNIDV
ncbi:MAG: hypothetical protein PHH85_10155 [Candidatus Methanoperedens sp.]|nr:hypothetical protein [Candidatus Methanoperedens sp.]